MEPIYTGARAQSQDLLSEIRAANVLDKFQDLKIELDYWEYDLKKQYLTFEEINEHSKSLIKKVIWGQKRSLPMWS